MRNYRSIASNKSYINALSSGQSQGAEIYVPIIYSDDNIFSYFYVDFRKELKLFSLGMILESVQVLGKGIVIPVSSFKKITNTKYKFTADISNQEVVTFVNKKNSWLTFNDGKRMSEYSVSFIPAGSTTIFKPAYCYDTTNPSDLIVNTEEVINVNFFDTIDLVGYHDYAICDINTNFNTNETLTIQFS